MDVIVKGGYIVFRHDVRKADIGIKDGKIVAIADAMKLHANKVVDASGQYVLPGMVDTHIHLNEPGRTEWEGFETGTKAMAAGGTTSYIEMPLNALPATTNKEALHKKLKAAEGQNYVDYAFYGGLVPNNLNELEELDEEGVPAFKCFIATCGSDQPSDFSHVDDYSLYHGMQKLAELNQILIIHAENPNITDRLADQKIKSGQTTIMDYVDSRPIFTEVEAVRRALYFAELTNCSIHFAHISSSEAVQEIILARSKGLDVTLESCPHYFAISAEEFVDIGNTAKCAPPLRRKKDQERLWGDLLNGHIDWLASDHSPCTEQLKQGNIFEAWGGISGCQHSVDLMFDLAVKKRGLSVSHFAKLIATNPAKRFNLYNKGEIAVGKDADLILLDPNQSYRVRKEDLYYKNKISPYIGRKINCRITKTFVRGYEVYNLEHGIVGEPIGELMTLKQTFDLSKQSI